VKTRTYQLSLAAAVTVCILLGAALIYVMRSHFHFASEPASQDPVVARGSATDTRSGQPGGAMAAQAEPALTAIQLSPQRMQEIGVTTALVSEKNISDAMHVPGNVEIDEQRLSYVQTRFAGWIQNVTGNATYQYVRKGQQLFTIYSPDIVSSEEEYLLAAKNQKAFSQDMHGTANQESGWMLQAAEERLQQYGVSAAEIEHLKQSGKVQRELAVDSPVSGFITERNALPNAYVQPEMKLYTIADLSTIWVYANVAQGDVGRLKPGNSGQVTVDAYPGRKFNGHIDQILPQVDQATRTVRVRFVLANPGIALKPGMYVNVDLDVPLGNQLVVPTSAVLQAGSRAIAFVDHGEGNLEPRAVETGPAVDDSVVILKGLKVGERVVTSANFLVDSEAQLQASFGNGDAKADAPAAGQSGAQGATAPSMSGQASAPAEKVQIDLATDPAPPRKGQNIVRVKLTGPDGKPVIGMQVSATFFMPAMPAMGMAAEHAQAALIEKGNGLYEGSVQLETGGTFSVTVTVKRGGQTIGMKKISVTAAGGM
jgi:Cu(I)/Ag(I) efflux system membrane fusion protein/cobalt-zinc-cadmium efflux system membrane fusion protein